MATADKITAPLLPSTTPSLPETAAQVEEATAAPIHANRNNSRLMLSSQSPLLHRAADSTPATASPDADADPVQEMKTLLQQTLADNSADNPGLKAKIDSLFQLLEECEQGTGDPKQLAERAKQAFSDVLGMLQQALPDSADTNTLFQELTRVANGAIDEALAPANTASEGAAKPSQNEYFKAVLAMVKFMMEMLVVLANATAKNAENQQDFLSKVKDALKAMMDKQADKIREQCDEQIEAQHQSFWARFGSILLGALLIAVTFLVAGPIAAMIVAAMFVLQQTGVMDQMFSGIDNPTARMFAKIGFAIGVGLVGGGLAAGLDAALADAAMTTASTTTTVATTTTATTVVATTGSTAASTTVATTATTAVSTATSTAASTAASSTAATAATTATDTAASDAASTALDEATVAQLDELSSTIASDAADSEAAEAGSAVPKPMDAFKAGMWSGFKNLGTQTFFMTDPVTDLVNAIVNPGNDPEKKKKAMWIAFGINLALALATLKMGGSSQSLTAEMMTGGLEKLAQTSNVAKVLNAVVKVAKSPAFIALASLFCIGFTGYWNWKLGDTYDDMKHNKEEQGPIAANLGMLTALTQLLNQEIQQSGDTSRTMINSLGKSQDVHAVTDQGKFIAEIYG